MPAFPKPPVDVYPLLAAVSVGCIAGVWSMARNLLVNPEVCCTKKYREGDSLWNENAVLQKAEAFRPFPFILRDIAKLGKPSTASGSF